MAECFIGPDSEGNFLLVENITQGSIADFCEFASCICNTNEAYEEEVEDRIELVKEEKRQEEGLVECFVGPDLDGNFEIKELVSDDVFVT